MADGSQAEGADGHVCKSCKRAKPITAEHWKATFGARGLQIGTKCRTCANCAAELQSQKRAAAASSKPSPAATDVSESERDSSGKENGAKKKNTKKKSRRSGGANFDMSGFLELLHLTPAKYAEFLEAAADVHDLSAIVDTTGLDSSSGKARADEIAALLWEHMDYRFSQVHFRTFTQSHTVYRYHTHRGYHGKDASSGYVRYIYYCGQQKYNVYLLCKHLVQALMPPPPAFFTRVLC
uniref:GATA-type domain-containing protein n=1 Tax=Mycena chlorophos TaxID=658473 RepID=A0ABQ0L3F8_MYCCL|nr:predicted protein [Mycena chlorophos]